MLYGHGDDLYQFGANIKINFSSNIYGKTNLSGLYRHLAQRIACLAAYPEPVPATLEALLAADCGLLPDQVCVTSGVTEAIYLIAQAFHGAKSYVLQPAFSEYADACRLHRHTVKTIPVDTVDAIDDEAGVVWLCNPNNPTGTVLPEKTLVELTAAHPAVCFVIDQSYEDFTAEKLFSAAEAAKMPHVMLLHSATKRYAVPGLRLGYITAPSTLLRRIRMQRMPWSVNAAAIEAGYWLLANKPPLQPPLDELLSETGRLQTAISRMEIAEVWPTGVHFFLARLRAGKAGALKHYLAGEHGILIRNASNFEGLDDTFIRIATQSPEENNQLINALEEWKRSFIS